jgi:hypothetical protein
MAQKKSKTVSDTLRDVIRTSTHEGGHMTHYRLGQLAGIRAHVIDAFMGGKDMRLGTVDKVCDVLGLGLVKRDPHRELVTAAKQLLERRADQMVTSEEWENLQAAVAACGKR